MSERTERLFNDARLARALDDFEQFEDDAKRSVEPDNRDTWHGVIISVGLINENGMDSYGSIEIPIDAFRPLLPAILSVLEGHPEP